MRKDNTKADIKNSISVNARNKMKNGRNIKSSRQKSLMPTLKERQRYLVYQLEFDERHLDTDLSAESILNQCRSMLGIFDGASAGLIGVRFNIKNSRGIIRVNNRYVDKLRTCLGLIKTIKTSESRDKPVMVNILYVTGIINKAMDRLA